jgi:hypothetical protein
MGFGEDDIAAIHGSAEHLAPVGRCRLRQTVFL